MYTWRFLHWRLVTQGAPLAVALLLATGLPVAHAQDGAPEPAAAAAAGSPRDPGPGSASAAASGSTTLDAAAASAPTATSTPPAAASGPCSSAYGLYADSTGRYTSGTCTAPSNAGAPAAVPLIQITSAMPCELYPSGSQPTTSTFGAPAYPVTPAPAPAQAVAARGMLAGAGC
jgi:hypothetical protein